MDQLNNAEKLLNAKKYKEALEIYVHVIKEEPGSALAYQGVAECQFHLGKFGEAIAASYKAIEIDPRLSNPHTILALIYGRNGNLEKSRAEATVALELTPKSFEALSCYGAVLLAEGKYLEAETFLQEALEINPDSIPTRQNLAVTYMRIGNTRKYTEETGILFKRKPSVENGIRLLMAFQYRYVWLVSILAVGIMALTLVSRVKVLLVIPGLYVIWAVKICYRFAKAHDWRNTATYLIATILFTGLLYVIYNMING